MTHTSTSLRVESTLQQIQTLLNESKGDNVKTIWVEASHKPKVTEFVFTIFTKDAPYTMRFASVKNWEPLLNQENPKFQNSVNQMHNFVGFLFKELNEFLK